MFLFVDKGEIVSLLVHHHGFISVFFIYCLVKCKGPDDMTVKWYCKWLFGQSCQMVF